MAREIDEAFIEEAIKRYQRLDALRAEFDKALTTVEVTVRSADGLFEVVVAADGVIRSVNVVGSLAGRSDAQVSRSATEAVTAAGDAARWARERLHSETFGASTRP